MKKQLTAIAGRLHQLAPSTPEQSTPFNFAAGAAVGIAEKELKVEPQSH
jgi:hypothetical protein